MKRKIAKKAKKTKSTEPNTIFVQIASYRDPQLKPTIMDMLEKADYPENLRIGIAWQHAQEDDWDDIDEYKTNPNFRIIDIHYKDSQGVCWARNAVQQLYKKEKYTLQLDSHHRFVQGWDTKLINMLQYLQAKGHKKPLITAYIPSFDPDNDPAARIQSPWKMNFDRFIPEGAIFFLPANFDSFDNASEPLPARFYSAHFAFSIGDFAKEIQHDPNYYFHGEEISIAVRAFTYGYDLFHPNEIICWHEYTRKGRTKQWDDDPIWHQRNNSSHLRNRKLFQMDGEKRDIDFGKYDFGNTRSLKQYEKYAGISFQKRAVTEKVLNHITPVLSDINISDEEFNLSLIGIFKHCIDIQFAQVPEDDYDFWAVAFKDKDGNDVYRKDADKHEISRMKNDPDGYCKIWREFNTYEKPHSWIVWPHSESKGWADAIIGYIG